MNWGPFGKIRNSFPGINDFEKVAIVGAPRWVEVMIKLLAPIMEGEARTFSGERLQEAWDWVKH